MRHLYILEATFPKASIPKTEIKVVTLLESPMLEAGWEPIVVSFHDNGTQHLEPDGTYNFKKTELPEWEKNLFAILADLYDFGADLFKNWQATPPHEQLERIKSKLGEVVITEHEKIGPFAGRAIQEWRMTDAWAHSVNFGELCYSSDPSVDIEVTWRFKKCVNKAISS